MEAARAKRDGAASRRRNVTGILTSRALVSLCGTLAGESSGVRREELDATTSGLCRRDSSAKTNPDGRAVAMRMANLWTSSEGRRLRPDRRSGAWDERDRRSDDGDLLT